MEHARTEVSRIESEDVFVNLQVRGHCVVTQDGRTSKVHAGSFHFVDATRQFRQDYIEDPATQDWRVVSFRVARAHLVPLVARPDDFTAVAYDARSGGVNGVTASIMLAVWKYIDRLDRSAADAAESAVNTIAAAPPGRYRLIYSPSIERTGARAACHRRNRTTTHRHGQKRAPKRVKAGHRPRSEWTTRI